MTTRCTAARSCSGPDGSARSSSLSGRAGGSCCVRSICPRSSSRRSCCSKRRIWSRVSGSEPSSRGPSRAQVERPADPLDVDAEHARALAAARRTRRSRAARGRASRDSSPSRMAWIACSRRLSRSICSPPVIPSPSAPSDSRTSRCTACSSTARKKKRSKTRSNTRRSSGDLASVAASASRNGPRSRPRDLLERREGVEQLGRPDRQPLGAQRLAEVDDPRREASSPLTTTARPGRAARRRARPRRRGRSGA